MGGTCSMYEEYENEYEILVRKTAEKDLGIGGRIILK
jgi:hypothetical protein